MKQIVFWILVFCAITIVAIFVGWYVGLPNCVGMFSVTAGIAMLAVGYYAWKAKAENVEKIKKNAVLSDDEMAMIIQMRESGSNNLSDFVPKVTSEQQEIAG